ncbi:MAG TPA: fibronectin type III domain-containing protein [Thermodesulfobacteriota bacterium]|nr:fibronectin type III domain-containing protein [Thermodesulfobacteriota bacterium]
MKLGKRFLFVFLLFPLVIWGCGGGGGGGSSSGGAAPSLDSGSISLAWEAESAANDSGYTIYYGTASGSYDYTVDIPPQGAGILNHRLTNLTPGKTYFIVVTSTGADGESSFSNEVSGVAT